MVRFNAVYNASELTSYQKADFYTNGKEHYTHLFQDISNAKTCIFIEFYTIHHDMVGEKLVELLTQKAKEGVTVWVMCDFIANLSTPKKMFQPLVDAGGKNPWRDTQIRLEGASASVLNTYFLKDWLCSIKRSAWQDTISYLSKLK